MATAVWFILRTPLLDTDSGMYLENNPFRTAAYPLFLDVFAGPVLLAVQLLAFAGTAAWLAVQLERRLPFIAAAVIVLAIVGNPYVWQLQSSIMSEAMVIPLLAVMLGLFVAFFYRPSLKTVALIALLGGIATAIRPPMLPFVIAPLAAVWLVKVDRLRMLVVVLALWLAPVVLERVYSHAVHGDRVTSGLGRSVFMKAAMIKANPPPMASAHPLDRQLERALAEEFAPARAAVQRAPTPAIRYIVRHNYQACAGYGHCTEALARGFDLPEHVRNKHLLAAGLPRLRANPLGYLELNTEDYLKLWLLHPRKVPSIARSYNAFLAGGIPFQPLLGQEGQPTPASEQKAIYALNRLVFAGLGLLAFLLPLVLLFYRPNALTKASFVVLGGMQAVLIAGSFVATGLPRYPMGLWPLLIGGILTGLYGLWLGRSQPIRAYGQGGQDDTFPGDPQVDRQQGRHGKSERSPDSHGE